MFDLRKFAIVGAAAVATMLAVPAQADGHIKSWTGFYAGGQIGYGWGESNHTDINGVTTGDFDVDGAVGGVTLGYNIDAGSAVYGIETDFSFSDIGGSSTNNCPNGCSTDVDWLWTLRARVGFDANGFMPFITGGLAVADVYANTNNTASNSEVRTGWTIGGGLEFMLDNNWTVKGEYLYVDLGDVSVPTLAPTKAAADNLNIIRVGVNYKF